LVFIQPVRGDERARRAWFAMNLRQLKSGNQIDKGERGGGGDPRKNSRDRTSE
jgi:hypothetical protein